MPSTYVPVALVQPGPLEKTGQPPHQTRQGAGVVIHSAEGTLESALAVLAGPKRASWHLTVGKDGDYYQHYPLEAVTWHAGGDANPFYVGIECEGVAGEPLWNAQLASLVYILKFLKDFDRWPTVQRDVTLFEHNHFMPTSCPSGRIPWDRIIVELTQVPEPSIQDLIYACVSAAEFTRRGWNVADLIDADKAALRYVVSKL
jgi:N-acetyl-anhydromuramyl-L-alanine amidase AmpD